MCMHRVVLRHSDRRITARLLFALLLVSAQLSHPLISSATAAPPIQAELAKLIAGDAVAEDRFGYSVAIDGDTLVVGAYTKGGSNNYYGAAYVFTRNGGVWTQQAKLVPNDPSVFSLFGNAVAIDGDTIAVGAYGKGGYYFGNFGPGAVYIFARNGTTWTEQAKLTASDGSPGDYFGYDVSLDGDTVLVGVPQAGQAGAAYVYTRALGAWSQQAKLTAPDAASGNWFGASVSLAGETAVAGAYANDGYQGAAYVFERSGGAWSAGVKVTPTTRVAVELFGFSVAVQNGELLVGAFNGGTAAAGAAYVFSRAGGVWTQQGRLTASDGAANDNFGRTVDLDGPTAVIGAGGVDAGFTSTGAAYVFSRSGSSWSEQLKLLASDRQANDYLGNSEAAVAISGRTVLAGAPNSDLALPVRADAGSAYVFQLPPVDADEDGVLDDVDNCPVNANPDQTDSDHDGLGDVCDGDDDNDAVLDGSDNCRLVANPGQGNVDGDAWGDACDGDLDGDGFDNPLDNCPTAANPDQTDTDHDGAGDECDLNDDGDTVPDAGDNCPSVPNNDQADLDGDAIGDACDADLDGDGVDNTADNCAIDANAAQDDTDHDGEGDACDSDDDGDGRADAADNCPLVANSSQADSDGDGAGDACDRDLDGDAVLNVVDNCPNVANTGQADIDADGAGDACDGDVDGDGVGNSTDTCAGTPSGGVVDSGGCTIAQLCPCDGPSGTVMPWRNHGKYVSCVAQAANRFRDVGLISQTGHGAVTSAAAQSSCGGVK